MQINANITIWSGKNTKLTAVVVVIHPLSLEQKNQVTYSSYVTVIWSANFFFFFERKKQHSSAFSLNIEGENTTPRGKTKRSLDYTLYRVRDELAQSFSPS
jgi:hypothetical protein